MKGGNTVSAQSITHVEQKYEEHQDHVHTTLVWLLCRL